MTSASNIKRMADYWFVVTFVLVISIPPLTMVTSNNDDVRRTEKRNASELPIPGPDLRSLSEFPERFESYFGDNFGFRDRLIFLHNLIKVVAFGASPSSRVVLGKEGWLFYNSKRDGNPIYDYRKVGQFSAPALKRKAKQLLERKLLLEKKDIRYLFAVVPNKSSIYPEFMPDRINRVGRLSLLDQFGTYVKSHTTVPFVDLRSVLSNAKEVMPVYARTGSHWNDFGAYVGSSAILDRLNTWFSDIEPLDLPQESFKPVLSPGEDLALMLKLDNVFTEHMIVRGNPLPDCGGRIPIETPQFTVYWGPSFSIHCNGSGHSALVFRDSFTEALVPLLSQQFDRVTYVWTRPDNRSFLWYVNKHKPDVVLEIHSERYLRIYP